MYTSYFVIAPTLLAATDNWLIGSLAFSYALVSLARVSKEEEELLKIFEAQYAEYRQSVPGAICPKIFSKD
jgi:protein-S-isoprenylcysteine O-methyltransferase Ste14